MRPFYTEDVAQATRAQLLATAQARLPNLVWKLYCNTPISISVEADTFLGKAIIGWAHWLRDDSPEKKDTEFWYVQLSGVHWRPEPSESPEEALAKLAAYFRTLATDSLHAASPVPTEK